MIRTKRQHPRLGPASEWSWQATSFTVSMIATLSLLAIGMPALAQHKHAISEQFVDGAPAVANEVIVKLRTNAGANAVAELPAPSSVFSWQNGNLLRSEIPRAFRFLFYPLIIVLAYRIHSTGASVLFSPTLLDVITVAACAATLGVGWTVRQHYKHSRAILPAWMIRDSSRFAMLLTVIALGSYIDLFEIEKEVLIWPGGLAALGLSIALRVTMLHEPAVAEALLAFGLLMLFELHWLALLLLPLHVAIVLDSRLANKYPSALAWDTRRTGAFAHAYGFAFAGGLVLSVVKEMLL